MAKEIITLQIGHYSNFIGTHWWNTQQSEIYSGNQVQDPHPGQDSIDHNVTFRSGLNSKGEETYTPRLICVDLKDCLKTLPQEGTLYTGDNDAHEKNIWKDDFKVSKSTLDHCKKNSFLEDLDKDEQSNQVDDTDFTDISEQLYKIDGIVDVWSDYSGTHYHPKSIHLVESFRHNSDSFPFHSFGSGQKLKDDITFIESWEDRLHFFVEECDNLQGFQVFNDGHDSFGGLGSTLLQNLYDDFGGKAILTFGGWPTTFHPTLDSNLRMLNAAMFFGQVVQYSDMFIPWSLLTEFSRRSSTTRMFPYINYNDQNSYHTSSILAACLDTISLSYRMHGSTISLANLCQELTQTGHKIACAALSLPFPMSYKTTINRFLQDTSCLYRASVLQSLTPSCTFTNTESSLFSQNVTLRGQLQQKSKTVVGIKKITTKSSLSTALSFEEVFDSYLKKTYPNTITRSTFTKLPLLTTAPYPQYFNPCVCCDGSIMEYENRSPQQIVKDVPVLASLCTSSTVFDTLLKVVDNVKKINLSKYHQFQESGIERDELYENLESVISIAQTYDATREFKYL